MSLLTSDETDDAHESASHEVHLVETDEFMNSGDSSGLSSPPSSPPVVKPEPVNTQQVPSRKRSREEMNAESDNHNDSSATIEGTIDRVPSQGHPGTEKTDLPAKSMASAAAHSMPPSKAPISSMPPPSQKPPRSGQGSQYADAQSQWQAETTQRNGGLNDVNSDEDDMSGDELENAETQTTSDPKDNLVQFDWVDLEQRYHDKMNELTEEEASIMAEFQELSTVSVHACNCI